ncbi:putative ATP-dependent RNA helicase TDRD12 isoform X1 [Gadus macrocephalus]|uniref:putative ATP-dependent RNA helicase TDRD12 isoform X1 n=1 Tax=Gadus macrocephalus TaxID=80720 RepID=UPI0028CB92FD|nr:putative ATP-dependent RNA helicase TDRD12 isoform X1 [Gadus macrocephalus]
MQNISILKVESPWCLWGRVRLDSEGHHEDLQVRLNLHYHDVTLDTTPLKPCSILEGQVCVLYWSMVRCWCRATVESVVEGPVSMTTQVRCFLVDHGERVVVMSDQICLLEPEFLLVPFQARRYRLAGVRPTTLRLSICEEKALLIPSNTWDSSATRYLHNLLQASTQMEALLMEEVDDSSSIELYLTIQGVKICVNDDLVAKRFGYYCGEELGGSEGEGQTPAMLAWDIFSDTDRFLASNGCSIGGYCTLTSPRTTHGLQGRIAAAGAQKRTADPTVQRSLAAAQSSQEEERSAGEGGGAGRPAGCERARTEGDTDASLLSDLTNSLSLYRMLKFLNSDAGFRSTACPDEDQPNPPLNPTIQPPNPIVKSSNPCPHPAGEQPNPSPNPSPIPAGDQLNSNLGGEYGHLMDVKEILNGELAADWLQDVKGEELQSSPTTAIWGRQKRSHEDEDPSLLARETMFGPAQTPSIPCGVEDRACTRLLQWLDAQPQQPQLDPKKQALSDPCREGVLLHSALPIEPCSSLADAPITHLLNRVLVRLQHPGPAVCECYSWPAVARGCDALIISPRADHPLSYLPPLLTNLLLSPPSPSTHSGPIAVILCPGWEKAQTVAEILDELQASHTFHPITVLLGVAKDEAKTVKIPKNCLLLVTTPFSLLRLISCHCFLFLRLSHLILDQADLLYTLAPEQMSSILQHFQKVSSGGGQVLAVSRRWSDHMEGLLTNHMSAPCVVITLPEEAALYAGVHQRTLLALETNRASVLLEGLDLSPEHGQKTLIITNTVEEVEQVFRVVKTTSALCLKAHQASTDLFEASIEQWRKDVGPGTQVILVTTDVCVRALGVRDATCVVHYGFPTSRRLFGRRLFSMAANFRNLLEQHQETPAPQSLLIISERNARHVPGVLRYLERTPALLPPELLSFAQGVLLAHEQSRAGRPLCIALKSFGLCSRGSSCPDRHQFDPQQDRSLLPASGVLTVLPLCVKTASVFCGRILSQSDDGFEKLSVAMATYYSEESADAKELVVGGLYGLKEDQCYHRVRVLCEPQQRGGPFLGVPVCLVDEGREQEVRFHQLRQLPAHLQLLPEQAVEMVVCGVRPTDSEPSWNPEVTRVISQQVRGHQHQARVVFSLGNTVFLDPMVKVRWIPGVKTCINDHDVRRLILDTGKGTSNPEHLALLKDLCQGGGAAPQGGGAPPQADTDQMFGPPGPPEETLEAAESRLYPSQTSEQETPGPECSEDQPLQETLDDRPEDQMSGGGGQIRADVPGSPEPMSRLHPQVRWYETADRVVVTLKLTDPEQQTCDFYPDRVVYSGSVGGRWFRADLALSGTVAPDACSWTLRGRQPVLLLLKEPATRWNQLLTRKNPLVSYDLEHWEEEKEEEEKEDATHRGVCFVEDTGEECGYVLESSDSDSCDE